VDTRSLDVLLSNLASNEPLLNVDRMFVSRTNKSCMEDSPMKRSIIAIVLVLAVSYLIFGQAKKQSQATSAEQELIQLEKDWDDATVKRDAAAMKRIVADDSLSMGPDGNFYTKAEMIAAMTSAANTTSSSVMEDIKARVLEDVGVTWSLTTDKSQSKGKEVGTQSRHVTTWVKRSGRWQLFAGTSAEVVKK
jgi:uncharacterized protein (TIGR02246 family)